MKITRHRNLSRVGEGGNSPGLSSNMYCTTAVTTRQFRCVPFSDPQLMGKGKFMSTEGSTLSLSVINMNNFNLKLRLSSGNSLSIFLKNIGVTITFRVINSDPSQGVELSRKFGLD